MVNGASKKYQPEGRTVFFSAPYKNAQITDKSV
jgi:hypothetical protein